jgi:hypothetical protein
LGLGCRGRNIQGLHCTITIAREASVGSTNIFAQAQQVTYEKYVAGHNSGNGSKHEHFRNSDASQNPKAMHRKEGEKSALRSVEPQTAGQTVIVHGWAYHQAEHGLSHASSFGR